MNLNKFQQEVLKAVEAIDGPSSENITFDGEKTRFEYGNNGCYIIPTFYKDGREFGFQMPLFDMMKGLHEVYEIDNEYTWTEFELNADWRGMIHRRIALVVSGATEQPIKL